MDSVPVQSSTIWTTIFAWTAELYKLKWHDHLLPISVLATLHAVRGALFARYTLALDPKTTDKVTHVPWLQALIFNLVLSLGGGIVIAFLYGHHIFWLTSNEILPLYSAIHFIIMYSPFDFVFKIINGFWYLINPVLVVADGLIRGSAMLSTVDYIKHSGHIELRTSYVATIVGGTVAACGGALLVDFFGLNQIEWGVHTPAFARKVPFGVKVAFILTVGYVISISPELPIYGHVFRLVSHLIRHFLPEFEWALEGENVNIAFLHFVFRGLFVLALLYDEFVNAPLVAFKAPGTVIEGKELGRDASDLSILPKEESINGISFSPKVTRFNSNAEFYSSPQQKPQVSTRKPFGEESQLSSKSKLHFLTKSSKHA